MIVERLRPSSIPEGVDCSASMSDLCNIYYSALKLLSLLSKFCFLVYQDSVNADGPPIPTHKQVCYITKHDFYSDQ